MKTILVVISDLHINSTVALSDKVVQLDDGGQYHASKSQMWLLENWNDFWNKVKNLLQGNTRLVTVINGDLVDINKHSQYQLISNNRFTIIDHAFSILHPIRELSEHMFIGRGTEAHTGGSGELEEILARELDVSQDTPSSYWYLQLEIEHMLFDFTHHGSVGSRPWTLANPATTLGHTIYYRALQNKVRVPNVAFRSHNHVSVDTYDNAPVRVIQTPCWQLDTSFVHRLGIVNQPSIGGVIVEIENGEYTIDRVMYPVPEPEPIRI